MTRLTYDDFDKMVKVCERIHEENMNDHSEFPFVFSESYSFPKVEDLKQLDYRRHFKKYLPMFVFYTEVDLPKLEKNPEFLETKKYMKKILREELKLVEG